MIPISMGGIGLREISFVYLFSLIGISNENALVISIGAYLRFIIAGMIGAGIFLYSKMILQSKLFLTK